jgi:polysaccharide pyruvyl transferase CsaB
MRGARTVLVAGYYGFGNAGDEAILAAVLASLRKQRPELQLVVASGDPARTRVEHDVDAVTRDDLGAVVAAARDCDLVVLGGGGLFQDYWPVPLERCLSAEPGGLPAYFAFAVLAAALGKPLVILAAGVGPLATAESRRLACAAFELATLATVRDTRSREALAECGLEPDRLPEVAADPAFLLAGAADDEVDRLLAGHAVPAGEPLLGVALRHWPFHGDAEALAAAVARAVDVHLDTHGGRALLVPFQHAGPGAGEDDAAMHDRVMSRLAQPGRATMLRGALPPALLAGVLRRCSAVVAMRYHAALFGLAGERPVVALAYDPKVEALLADAGLDGLALQPYDWSSDALSAALDLACRIDTSARLRPFVTEQRRRAAQALAAMAALARGARPASAAAEVLAALALQKGLRGLELEQRLAQAAAAHELAEAGQAEAERERAASEGRREEAERARAAEEAERIAGEIRSASLLAQRDDVQARLSALEATAGYRLLSAWWRLARRLRGSTARRHAGEPGPVPGASASSAEATPAEAPPAPSPKVDATPPTEPAPEPAAGPPEPPQPPAPPTPTRATEAAPLGPPSTRSSFEEELRAFARQVEERAAPRLMLILSGTALRENEGQRPTQLALELSRRGIPVVFAYHRWSTAERAPQDRLAQGILQLPLDEVAAKPAGVAAAFAGRERVAMFELPWPPLLELAAAVEGAGWITVYDALDDWQEFHDVGQAPWYDGDFERYLLGAVDLVLAVTPPLAERLRALGGPQATVLGNGVRDGCAEVRRPLPLRRGAITVGYFGYLASAWVDFPLLAAAARHRPEWLFYLIGYGEPLAPLALPDNVVALGPQPAADLAAHAANWDVAVVPFLDEPVARVADPIKTYEYLAMGLPVVVTGVHAPAGAEHLVARATGLNEFLASIERAAGLGALAAERRAFAAGCRWSARVDSLLALLDAGAQRVAEKRSWARAGA